MLQLPASLLEVSVLVASPAGIGASASSSTTGGSVLGASTVGIGAPDPASLFEVSVPVASSVGIYAPAFSSTTGD